MSTRDPVAADHAYGAVPELSELSHEEAAQAAMIALRTEFEQGGGHHATIEVFDSFGMLLARTTCPHDGDPIRCLAENIAESHLELATPIQVDDRDPASLHALVTLRSRADADPIR